MINDLSTILFFQNLINNGSKFTQFFRNQIFHKFIAKNFKTKNIFKIYFIF